MAESPDFDPRFVIMWLVIVVVVGVAGVVTILVTGVKP